MQIDFKDSSRKRLLKLIQDLSPQFPIADNSIAFGNPVVTTQHGRNTHIEVGPNPDIVLDKTNYVNTSPVFKKKRTFFYNRIPLNTVFPNGLEMMIPSGATTLHDVLDYIFQTYNVRLLPDDVINAPIQNGIVTLQAEPLSLGWIGSIDISFGDLIDAPPGTVLLRFDQELFTIGGLFLRFDV